MNKALLALALLPGLVSAQCPFSGAKPTGKDMHRARSTQQSPDHVGGNTHDEIATKINRALEADGAEMQECAEFTLQELNQIIRDMHCHFNEHLSGTYPEEDGRRRRHETLDHFENSWLAELEKVNADPTVEEPIKLAKCAEVLMMFTHHLPRGAREMFNELEDFVLPYLPSFNEEHASHPDEEVAETYSSSYTCQTGHGMTAATDDGSDHVLPHWPKETHYLGTGHGAYPFWVGTAGAGGSAPIEVWWSERQAAEKFYHSTCYMSEVGYSGGSRRKTLSLPGGSGLRGHKKRVSATVGPPPPPPTNDDDDPTSTPCYHLMTGVLGSAKAYLYTEDEDFCCESTGTPEDLAPPQSDFMDLMTLEGTYSLETEYFSGLAYHYTMNLPDEVVTDFWYDTTVDGYPLQQGEGGTDADTQSGFGVFIYHDYNYTTWANNADVSIDSSVFDIPTICKTTSNTCAFP